MIFDSFVEVILLLLFLLDSPLKCLLYCLDCMWTVSMAYVDECLIWFLVLLVDYPNSRSIVITFWYELIDLYFFRYNFWYINLNWFIINRYDNLIDIIYWKSFGVVDQKGKNAL